MADIVEYFPEDNSISIRDLKTNFDIYKKSYNKMLYPLDHLRDDKIMKYTLQLGLYCYLLERKGFKIREHDLCLYWINPEDRDIYPIEIEYKRKDIIAMVAHYTSDAF